MVWALRIAKIARGEERRKRAWEKKKAVSTKHQKDHHLIGGILDAGITE